MKDLFGLIAALPLVAAAQSVVTYNLDFATSDGPVTGTLSLVDVTAGYITASDVVSYDFTGPSGLDAVGTSATCMTGCPIEAVGNTLVWSPPEDFVGSNNLDNQYTFSVKGATFGGNIGIGPDGCYPSYGTDTCGGAIFVTNPGMVGELGLFFDEVLGTSTAAVANPAPEIDESGAIAALTLFLGMLAAMSGRGRAVPTESLARSR